MSGARLRPLATLEEFRACVRLQHETWGEGFSQAVPVSMLEIATRIGGVALGAFDERESLIGFVFGLTGIEGGRLVHWSDMLAVRSGERGRGLGRRLKLAQREMLLERGVECVYWTFDPLEARNAHLNLNRLGAVCREYVEDMYGPSDSVLHRGLGTDRFVATWELASPRVRSRLSSGRGPPDLESATRAPAAFGVRQGEHGPLPAAEDPRPPAAAVFTVPVPADIQALRNADPGAGAAWRDATRAVFAPALTGGAQVTALIPGVPVAHYVVSAQPPGSTDSSAGRGRPRGSGGGSPGPRGAP